MAMVAVGLAIYPSAAAPQSVAQSTGVGAPGTFSFKLPLPQPLHGAIYELKAKVSVPAGTTFSSSGNPFVVNVTNGSRVPSYIRAAGVELSTGKDTWELFIAINAPKGLVNNRRLTSATDDTTLDLTAAAPGLGSLESRLSYAVEDKVDECDELLHAIKQNPSGAFFYLVFLGASPTEAEQIIDYAKKADTHCP
jgi:hypothetical protein